MKTDIASLKEKVSLVEFARGKTRLEKKGEKWWGCCPLHPDRNPSFEIQLKSGVEVFHCHGCQAGGDVLTFIEQSESLSTSEAIGRLKELAGVGGANKEYIKQVEEVERHVASVVPAATHKTIPFAGWKLAESSLQNSQATLKWLHDTRGLSPETAKSLHLGYDNQGHILFPRVYGDKILTIKYRAMKSKSFYYAEDMEAKSLFNVDTINPLEPIFVTEGEFDAAILEQCGYRAVSLPSAGVRLLPNMKKALKEADCVYLAGDNDGGVGNQYMKQLARELGENTFMLTWPTNKDANGFYLEACKRDPKVFYDKVQELMKVARQTPVEGFTSILGLLATSQGTDLRLDPTRLHFPWPAIDAMNFNPRGSIVVIYSTYSGTGKTVFTTQVAVHEAKRGEVVVVYSPELRDENYLALLAAQWAGAEREGGLDRGSRITQEDYKRTAEILEWTYPAKAGGPAERRQIQFYVGHSLPCTATDEIVDFIEHTIKATGATRFVIDTLHRIISAGPKENLFELEGRIIKRLEAIANKYGTIIILIGQSNKEAEGIKERNRNEQGILRGSRELTDVPNGIYLLHRAIMPKEGPASVNLLSPETEVILKKDRGKGPGNVVVPMLYRRDTSRFVVREVIQKEAFRETPQEESIF